MNVQSSVRLKRLLVCLGLLLALLALVDAAPTNEARIAQDERLAQERTEKEFADTLVARANNVTTSTTTQKTTTTTAAKKADEGNTVVCKHFDENECDAEGKCDVVDVVCYEEEHLTVVGCTSVYDLSTYNGTVDSDVEKMDMKFVKRMGCMQYPADLLHGCEKDLCRQSRSFGDGFQSCCCLSDHCNSEVHFTDEKVGSSEAHQLIITQDIVLGVLETVWPPFWLLVLVLATACVAACFVLVWAVCRRRKTTKKERCNGPDTIEEKLLNKTDQMEMRETPKELPITEFQLFCTGRFAKIYKATWTDEDGARRDVAVKKVNQASGFEHEKRIYELLRGLPKWYPSILKGICSEKIGSELWIVTEFHSRRSLFDVLLNHEISVSSCYRLALSMIDGLQFLHDDRPFYFGHPKRPIIHRDIKSKNILVQKDMTACIADFGLACPYDFDKYQVDLLGQVGTRRYMAPEVLQGAAEFTASAFKAMDVYSMGLVLWEVISRTKLTPDDVVPKYQIPYQQVGPNPSIGYMRNLVVNMRARPEFRPKVLADDRVDKLAEVAQDMWHAEASGRITAGCAFAKVWTIVQNARDGSEGYGSSHEVSGDIDEMATYHEMPDAKPHPSPDPFSDTCPSPPPIPDMTYQPKDIYTEGGGGEESQPSSTLNRSPEKVFDLAKSRLLSPEEQLAMNEDAKRRFFDRGGASETPTPSGSFGF